MYSIHVSFGFFVLVQLQPIAIATNDCFQLMDGHMRACADVQLQLLI
jgi:hypothetical protein